MKIECREMKQLVKREWKLSCPDCGSGCSAITMSPGLEVCNSCQTAALIPADMGRWQPHLPMMADYQINNDGTKKLLGWHPASSTTDCRAERKSV